MNLIVAGVGWAGEHHLMAVRALQADGRDVHVAALVDVDEQHVRAVAAQHGVEATYTDLPSALEAHPEAEGVVLATPHSAHRSGTEQAAAAGRHVLVEKPMALTLEDADAMIAACHDAGKTLMVAEPVRYGPRMVAVRQVLEAGKIGQPLSGYVNFIPRGHKTFEYPGRRAWLARPQEGGSGIWMLNGVHVMSAARMVFGDVVRIDARTVRSTEFGSDVEATVVALLDFDTDAVVTLTVSAELHGYRRFSDMVVFGSRGTLQLNWRRGETLKVYSEDGPP
ncbi:MAG: Gfo/Idh/MocA family oxidoreductase [Candidatus Brocadiia bacterium]